MLIGGAVALLDQDDRSGRTAGAGALPSAAATPNGPTSALGPGLSAGVPGATAPARSPARAQAALQELLLLRAESNLMLLRASWRLDQAAAAQAARAVATSGDELSVVVAAWSDPDVARRIRSGLDEQSAASRGYAEAVASEDAAVADRARARMGQVSRELGDLLAGVTGGRVADYVPPQDAARYRGFVDALEAGDAARADDAAAWLRARSAREGAALAAGLSEAASPGSAPAISGSGG